MVEVLVVGAGVVGLTSAVRLVEAGLRVRVIAADPPERTTSAVAGASWGPDLVTDPRGPAWSERGRQVFTDLAADPSTGVHLAGGIQAARVAVPPPAWAAALPDFRLCADDELPPGYVAGWHHTVPLIDMPTFLRYLVGRLDRAGVAVESGTITDLAEVAGTVVNCTGLGARELVPDDGFSPTLGQLVVVDNPGITEFFIDVDEGAVMTYFFPHADHVILGGTALTANLAPDAATAAAIVERCAAIEPRLRDAPVRGHRVGLRPVRATVRLERDGRTIHNYGHGGAGVTLSWGCADEVVELVTRAPS
jgi:D-amino-acid oxidase